MRRFWPIVIDVNRTGHYRAKSGGDRNRREGSPVTVEKHAYEGRVDYLTSKSKMFEVGDGDIREEKNRRDDVAVVARRFILEMYVQQF